MSDSRRTERQTYRQTVCLTHFLLFFLTTPDAPKVQFLESFQEGTIGSPSHFSSFVGTNQQVKSNPLKPTIPLHVDQGYQVSDQQSGNVTSCNEHPGLHVFSIAYPVVTDRQYGATEGLNRPGFRGGHLV